MKEVRKLKLKKKEKQVSNILQAIIDEIQERSLNDMNVDVGSIILAYEFGDNKKIIYRENK